MLALWSRYGMCVVVAVSIVAVAVHLALTFLHLVYSHYILACSAVAVLGILILAMSDYFVLYFYPVRSVRVVIDVVCECISYSDYSHYCCDD